MDRNSITRLKKALQRRRRELHVGIIKTQEEMLATGMDYGKDDADRANTSLAKELTLGQKSRDRTLLSEVEAALARIGGGTFGECLNCGQEITVKRLEALPWVRYCITCQELIGGL